VCLVRPFVVPCPVSRSPHPVQMRAGRGPVRTERVCDRLATQNGCTGWKGRCGGSGPRGVSASFFLSFVPSPSPRIPLSPPSLAHTTFPIVFQHLVELQIRISVARRLFPFLQVPPLIWQSCFRAPSFGCCIRRGGGVGKAESVFCLLCCAAIWTLRCDFTLAFFLFGEFPHQC
jgi:hypothetical protein